MSSETLKKIINQANMRGDDTTIEWLTKQLTWLMGFERNHAEEVAMTIVNFEMGQACNYLKKLLGNSSDAKKQARIEDCVKEYRKRKTQDDQTELQRKKNILPERITSSQPAQNSQVLVYRKLQDSEQPSPQSDDYGFSARQQKKKTEQLEKRKKLSLTEQALRTEQLAAHNLSLIQHKI